MAGKARDGTVEKAKAPIMAQEAHVGPIGDAFGALGEEMEEAPPAVPAGVCLYIRVLLALANDHEILKGASSDVPPDINARCQRMANDSHVAR